MSTEKLVPRRGPSAARINASVAGGGGGGGVVFASSRGEEWILHRVLYPQGYETHGRDGAGEGDGERDNIG